MQMFDLSIILGLDKDEAVKLLEDAGKEYRIFEEEGQSNMLTSDVRMNRVNLNIVGGKVSSYNMG